MEQALLQVGFAVAEPTAPAEFILSPVVGMQLFTQFIAAVSQLIWHERVVVLLAAFRSDVRIMRILPPMGKPGKVPARRRRP